MSGKTRRQRDSGAGGSQITTGNGSIEKNRPVLQPLPNVKEEDENIFLFWPNIIGMDGFFELRSADGYVDDEID